MTLKELLSKITATEGLEIEFKAAQGGIPSSLWETASAFGNTNGGCIILGVAEEHQKNHVQGIKNSAQMRQDITNGMRNPQKINVELCGPMDIGAESIDGKDVIWIKTRAASTREKPVYIHENPYKGTFVRRNEGDYRCSKQEVDRMIRDASASSADSALLKGYTWEDLDKETFHRYRQHFRQSSPVSPLNALDDLRFMKALGGHRRDTETGQEGLTRAAVLMFGTREALLNLRPRHLIDFRLVPNGNDETGSRWEDRITWEGNLYDAFFKIYPRIVSSLKTPFKLEGPHRLTETGAHEALRESFVNMLAHTDYSEQAALLIKVSSNEFVFRNPGSSRVPEEDLLTADRSDPRNPVLLRMFRHVSLAEEAGTGLSRILQIWRVAGLQLPSVSSDTQRYEFKLSLKMVHLLSKKDRGWLARYAPLTEHEQIVLIHARNQGSINNASVKALTGLHRADATVLLTGLRDRQLLDQESSNRWASYKIPENVLKLKRRERAHKPIKKTYKEKSIKKETLIRKILSFCRTAHSAKEIAVKMRKNPLYLISTYLTPLVHKKQLLYTNPKHPTSRNQKYITAKKWR